MVYKLFKLLPLDLRPVAVPEDEIRIPVFADDPAKIESMAMLEIFVIRD